jgi:tetratricopeptide (TPR) repeat protein
MAKNQARRRNAAARIKLSETLTAKADALLENKETDKAIETYKNALKNNPQNQNAKLGLSEAYVIKGDETLAASGGEAAKVFYQEAIKADDSNYSAYAKLAHAFEQMKLNDDALTNYEKALKINPAANELLLPVANVYYQKNDYATAETYLRRAETNVPETAESVFLRGLLHYQRNENEKALASFNKLLNYDPDFIEGYLYQAEIYERLNRRKTRFSLIAGRSRKTRDPSKRGSIWERRVTIRAIMPRRKGLTKKSSNSTPITRMRTPI